MRIVDYGILAAGDGPSLVERVKALLGDGWEPLGAPFVTRDAPADQVIAQALVKTEAI